MSRAPSLSPFTTRRSLLAGAVALTATGLGLSACERSAAPTDEQGRVRLRFATDARAHAGHGGFYQAVASGAYEARGLNIEIVQGGPGVSVPHLLATNAVELGLASNSFTAMNLSAEGAPVKAVAAFFQKDPQVLLAHPDDELETIADLKGRPLYLADAARSTFWLWLKAHFDFTDDQLRRYLDDPAPFIADDQAVLAGELTADPYAIEQTRRLTPRTFLLADEGYPSYGALLLAPNPFARDNGQTLRNFIAASVEGWRDYLQDDPAEADALMLAANPDMSQAVLDQGRDRLRANAVVDGGDAALFGMGAMTPERWQAFFDMASGAGLYPAEMNWRDAFTNIYLPGRS